MVKRVYKYADGGKVIKPPTPTKSSTPFDTLEEAVYRAAHAAREKYGNSREAASVVYEQDGKFFFTDPYSQSPSNLNVRAKVAVPKGSARYFVHNHPQADRNDRFSKNDIQTADQLGIPSAIIYGTDPTIRTFTPGKTKSIRHRRESVGDEFGWAPPAPAPATPPTTVAATEPLTVTGAAPIVDPTTLIAPAGGKR